MAQCIIPIDLHCIICATSFSLLRVVLVCVLVGVFLTLNSLYKAVAMQLVQFVCTSFCIGPPVSDIATAAQ